MTALDVVTGAYGYSGRYITRRLLDAGRSVRTLTASPRPPELFHGLVEARPFSFERPELLVESLRGAETLYNTYWVRFPYRDVGYERAVENTRVLFASARKADVERIVHVSITNPDESSPLAYFRWKAVAGGNLQLASYRTETWPASHP